MSLNNMQIMFGTLLCST